MTKWFKNFGFALLVLAALIIAAGIALECGVPSPVPDFALSSEEIYRTEVGGGCFLGFYLAATALVWALNGRGITEVGAKGVKAKEFVKREVDKKQQKSIDKQSVADRAMLQSIEELKATTLTLGTAVREIRGRLDEIEKTRAAKVGWRGRRGV
jgi:hypothetical protein